MTVEVIHAFLRLLLTAIVIVKVTRFHATLNTVERIGLGMMGGSGLLTVDVIWQRTDSPYYEWAPVFFTLGAILFLGGRAWRDRRHEQRNAEARRHARDYLQARGKL